MLTSGTALVSDADGGVLVAPREGTVQFRSGPSLDEFSGELLVIGVTAPNDEKGEFAFSETVKSFDEKYASGALAELAADAEFKGKLGSSTDVVRFVGGKVKRVILYGLGPKDKAGIAATQASTFAVQAGKPFKACKSVGLHIENVTPGIVTSLVEGGIVGGYVDERYKEKKEDAAKVPEELVLVGVDITSGENQIAARRGKAIATGILTTKEVVAAPANCLTPGSLAQAARTVARECGLDVTVLGRKKCEELGMGCYLGVSQGSAHEPQFIHMTYKPKGDVKKKIAFVGKAVTFDSGGYNLKAGAGSMIELMKWDMGGSGTVLGSAKVIGTLKPENVEVHFIMPACENMISDKAIHPGDILKASNGKTVEVINTDAEGRLCLADALVYAENLGEMDYIVDIATLTGAIIVSLGNEYAGIWSSSDDLANNLIECGKASGDKLWHMPLVDAYSEQLKSSIADLRNLGVGRGGGSITAALFLKEFVKNKNWAHLDIAGTAWIEKKGGATGFGVKTFMNFVDKLSAASK